MDKDSILNEHEQVEDLLEEGRMKEALQLMASMMDNSGDYQLQQELNDVQTSYNYLLQYMEQGIPDPGREKLYKELRTKCFTIADQIKLDLLDEVSNSYYHAVRRKLKRHPLSQNMTSILTILESFDDSVSVFQLTNDEQKLLEDMKAHEAALRDMFTLTWINSRWSHADKNIAYKYLASELLNANDLSLLVSAVTLSLFMNFDIEKLFWLMEAFYHKDIQVKTRAEVGFAIVVYLYDKIYRYPGIETRISIVQEEMPSLADDLQAIFLQIIRSKDTERISKTMRDEIVPEVMKNIQQKMDNRTEDESEELDMNPDWMFDLGPKLNNKMSKIAELQQEGGDINMVSFSRLKNFTFFNELHNWFMPFYTMHSEVIKALGAHQEGQNKLQMKILQTGMFCNSDNYSMIMVMLQMPPEKRQMAFSGLQHEQMEEMLEEANIEKLAMRSRSAEASRRFYIQDLYRFFKLSAFAKEIDYNIFDHPIRPYTYPQLEPLLNRPDFLRVMADLVFKTEAFQEALFIYHDLENLNGADADVYQRIGYCYEVDKYYNKAKAVKYYEKALIIKPGNKWTLKHLATCYHYANHDKELACYEELTKLDPENHVYLNKLCRCLMENNQHERALQYFYKLDLTEDNNVKAWRGIAWCCFILDKMDQAQKYCEKLLAMDPDANDWLNAGHVAWCKGDFKRALNCYREANKLNEEFRDLYLNDIQIMEDKGINRTELDLMLELL